MKNDDRPSSRTPTCLANRPTVLLERDNELQQLRALVDDVRVGRGATVLIDGEPGIGKTALLTAALAEIEDVRCWVGACDDLIVALPRGPLREAVRREPEPLRDVVAAGHLGDVLDALVLTCTDTPTVIVIEDLQWADDATLDVISYLTARTWSLPLLLLVTLHEGDIGPGRPAEHAVACLSRHGAQRISPKALSVDAVAELAAGTGWRVSELLELTAGNPFFVTEAIKTAGPGAGTSGNGTHQMLPASVTDAVRARVSRLSVRTRRALEQVSVSPGGLRLELARTLLGATFADLVEAEVHGIIDVTDGEVMFRHELARRAVVAGLPALHARRLLESVTLARRTHGEADEVRSAHQAVSGGGDDAVARRGPQHSTRAHPNGLTRRQADVLALLAGGFTNAEIAGELVVSVRTVDHHVSAILAKLGVATRRQAARIWASTTDAQVTCRGAQ